MSQQLNRSVNVRQHPRLRLPAMYTLVRVRLAGENRYRWTGHIYDISISGMRFKLDQALPAGTDIEVRGMLPGQTHILFHAVGRVVRIHDDHDADAFGPTRMGMMFDRFRTTCDHQRLAGYLEHAGLAAA